MYSDGSIFSLSDFTDPHSYSEIGWMPEGMSILAAGVNEFWGLDREGIEQHLWRIPNIEMPENATKVGEFPERLPAFVDMAIYRESK